MIPVKEGCVHALQLGFVADLGVERNHKYARLASAEGTQPRPRLVRVGKEVASLNVDLPLNPSSSVFVRVDEQNMTLWQAVITGELPTLSAESCANLSSTGTLNSITRSSSRREYLFPSCRVCLPWHASLRALDRSGL